MMDDVARTSKNQYSANGLHNIGEDFRPSSLPKLQNASKDTYFTDVPVRLTLEDLWNLPSPISGEKSISPTRTPPKPKDARMRSRISKSPLKTENSKRKETKNTHTMKLRSQKPRGRAGQLQELEFVGRKPVAREVGG